MEGQKIKRELKCFDSHSQADEATYDYYRNLSPEQRLEIALDLMRPYYEAYPGFERVYRTVELGECPVSSDWGLGL
jgi:hypothetical protein